MVRTKAHALIQKRYVEQGQTTRFVVLPVPDSGLPQTHLDGGQPVTLDLLAGRPVNLALDDDGLQADLCFDGPPTRCTFPWSSVVAVQGEEGLEQTLVVALSIRMEDDSLTILEANDLPVAPPTIDDESPPSKRPALRVIDGGE